MPNELHDRLKALIAAIGINDGANKGFWRIQPRDDEGQWMEMGGDVIFRFRTGKGNLVVGTARGIYVGPSGKPGKARILVAEGNELGLAPGVHEMDSRNLTQVKAFIPQEGMEGVPAGNRTDKFGKPVKTLEDAKLPTLEDLNNNVQEPTADDERLARGELTDEEKAAEQDGRKNSPIADLPTGFEAENPEEVKKLLRESGIDPDEFDPEVKAKAPKGKKKGPSQEDIDEMNRRLEEFKKPNRGLFGRLKDYLSSAKKSKMKNPDLQFYSEYGEKRYPVSRGDIVVPGYKSGHFRYIDEDGNPGLVKVTKYGNGNMELDLVDSKGKTTQRLKVKQDPDSKKWGIYKQDETSEGVVKYEDKPISEFETSDDARNAVYSEVNEALGLDPSNVFSLLKGINALKKRNDNPRTKRRVDAIDVKPSEEYLSFKEEAGEAAIADVMADVAYDGDTDKTVDALLRQLTGAEDEESEPLLRQLDGEEETPRKRVVPAGLEPGDVVRSGTGIEQTVVDIAQRRDANGRLKIVVTLQLEDGTVYQQAVDPEARVSVWGPKRRLQRVPAPSRPAPAQRDEQQEAPAAPEAPEAPETPEEDFEDAVEVPVETLTPANFPPSDRIDDGSEFDLNDLSDEQKRALRGRKLQPVLDADGTPALFLDENNELKPAEDPFEIMNVLAEAHPNAKFTPDGKALILHRQKDKDGRIFELRVSNTGKKAIAYSLRWTDPNTGEIEELQYKNDAHSISAALGKYDGAYLLDRILGRKPEHEVLTFGRGDTPATRATMEDSLRKRAEIGFMGSKDPSNSRRKLVTLAENALRLAMGRNVVLHKNGTIHQSELPSLWEAFDAFIEDRNDVTKEDFYHVLYGIFGNAPLDEKSHAAYMSALRAEFTRRYKGKINKHDTRSFHGLVTSASERMRGIYRGGSPKIRSIKYASKDRTRAIEQGMTVEYTNGVGDTSIVKVKKLVQGTGARSQAGDIYDFGDYVIIEDSEGNTRKINALKLRILKDQNTPLTRYIPNPQGAELRRRRKEQGLFVPDYSERILGEGFVLSAPPQGPVFVDDLTPGDVLPSKDGKPIGTIIAVKPITSKNGTPGYAFLVRKPDGEEVRVNYAQGTELELKKA